MAVSVLAGPLAVAARLQPKAQPISCCLPAGCSCLCRATPASRITGVASYSAAHPGFPYPVSLTMWHMAFCAALAWCIIRAGWVEGVQMNAGEAGASVWLLGDRR